MDKRELNEYKHRRKDYIYYICTDFYVYNEIITLTVLTVTR